MPDSFESAIDTLVEIATTARSSIHVTLDLTNHGTIAGALRDLAAPTPGLGLSLIHRPDDATEAESKFVRDLLALLANPEKEWGWR